MADTSASVGMKKGHGEKLQASQAVDGQATTTTSSQASLVQPNTSQTQATQQLDDTLHGVRKVGRKRRLFNDSRSKPTQDKPDRTKGGRAESCSEKEVGHPSTSTSGDESGPMRKKSKTTENKFFKKPVGKSRQKKDKQNNNQAERVSQHKDVTSADQSFRTRLKGSSKEKDHDDLKGIFSQWATAYQDLMKRLH